ncbi:MAG TPA: hypothetical protein PLV83_05560 [Bacilli bacterium]|mgnify:CR=1 FL=1|nr:hypothetical protein [Bacilli bacterium]
MNANTIGWTKVLVDLPTGQQIANAGGLTTWTDDGTSTSNVPGLSTWLYCNLSENSAPYGYWTKTPHTRYTGGAWYVADGMNVSSVEGHVNFSSRPVITISKSDL